MMLEWQEMKKATWLELDRWMRGRAGKRVKGGNKDKGERKKVSEKHAATS